MQALQQIGGKLQEHDKAIADVPNLIDAKLKPLEERLRQVDLVMVIPKRADLISLNAAVNQHEHEAVDHKLIVSPEARVSLADEKHPDSIINGLFFFCNS